jgi:hypothetical protein
MMVRRALIEMRGKTPRSRPATLLRTSSESPRRWAIRSGFYRLLMAPGLLHCGGGRGPNVLATRAAITAWVEKGTPPDRLIATKFVDDTPARPSARPKARRLPSRGRGQLLLAWDHLGREVPSGDRNHGNRAHQVCVVVLRRQHDGLARPEGYVVVAP